MIELCGSGVNSLIQQLNIIMSSNGWDLPEAWKRESTEVDKKGLFIKRIKPINANECVYIIIEKSDKVKYTDSITGKHAYYEDITLVVPDTLKSTVTVTQDYNDFLPSRIDRLKVIGGGPNLRSIKGLFSRLWFNKLDLKDFDMSNVVDMTRTFHSTIMNCKTECWTAFKKCKPEIMNATFNKFTCYYGIDLNCFDTSNVINMIGIFRDCSAELKGKMDVSNVKVADEMFEDYCCGVSRDYDEFKDYYTYELDLSWADFKSLESAREMFRDCKIKGLRVSENINNAVFKAQIEEVIADIARHKGVENFL